LLASCIWCWDLRSSSSKKKTMLKVGMQRPHC
jgi:hypothetical protein